MFLQEIGSYPPTPTPTQNKIKERKKEKENKVQDRHRFFRRKEALVVGGERAAARWVRRRKGVRPVGGAGPQGLTPTSAG